MDLKKLDSEDLKVVETYVRKKFLMFMKLKQDKREKKIAQYYGAVRYQDKKAAIVERIYEAVYHKKLKSDDSSYAFHRDIIGYDLAQLNRWERDNSWQEGEDFLNKLKSFMSAYDTDACNDVSYQGEFSAEMQKAKSGSTFLTGNSIGGEFDAMLGLKQEAAFKFAARTDMGELTAKLEESLKLGVWANGQAKAKMRAVGLSVDAQFMAAIGAELNIDGELKWQTGEAALALAGGVRVFGGVRGNAGLGLSLESRGRFNASIEAGAFAGFEVECSGQGSFTYAGETVVLAGVDFALQLGVGAQFSAGISSSIFGPTTLALDMGFTLGIGMSVAPTVAVNFASAYTLGKDAFRTVLYLPTIAKGYKMELMTSDSKNRYFLKKCQVILQEEFDAVQEVMDKGKGGYVKLH